ncbi:ribulose-bisphosphate carboxylase large subunit family protein [Halorarum halobium]|uniref:ribulose-bisphosphate carboxylase large subunit family protein n=1 Tax=Halorarum halobium TaxID=3075121 RepID=UPI0028A7442F|nr:ribulose-bisphosphate carboxylase large subunit family protein [Halobaculum sp. XH14]
MERIRARYRIETPYPLDEAAAAIAGEQSSGTFVDVPAETESLQERHGATVEEITELETVEEPTLPGARTPAEIDDSDGYRRAEVVVSYPGENVGTSLPNLVTTVGGNLFELRHFSGLRLFDIDVPAALADAYPGPQFGIEGTREIVDVYDRPLIGTIIKPSVGLSPAETGELVGELLEADLDFIKDDELIASPPYSPVKDRVTAVMGAIDSYRDETGNEVMYACNITGDVDEMLERHDAVVNAGGNCVMVSMNSVGLSALTELRKHADVPIHAHRNGWGALSRCPELGYEYQAYHQFFRLAGADQMHVNGIRNKFCESDESVIKSAKAVQTPIASDDDVAMPVFSSGQWADQAADTHEALGNVDLLYLAGGGILGHPDGPAAGVDHLKQGWEAAMKGIPLDEHAKDHQELRVALDHYERR